MAKVTNLKNELILINDLYDFRSKIRRPFGIGNGQIQSFVIGISAILVHGLLLGIVQYSGTVEYFNFQVPESGYILIGILSFYIFLNIFLLVGILKKIRWILITWMTFTILHVGLAFLVIHTYFSVNWITILVCIGLVISTTISVLVVEENCWTIKSGSATTNVISLETFRN